MDYESLIDPTDIATVAAYLRNPRSPIQCVLHVRERALLAPLAAELAAAMEQPNATGLEVRAVIQRRLRDRHLLLSPRPSQQPVDARVAIDLGTLPAEANCEVIYLPPFYLTHTPGLFEGTLTRRAVTNGQAPAPRQGSRFRV